MIKTLANLSLNFPWFRAHAPKGYFGQYLFFALIFSPLIIAFSVFAFDPSDEFLQSFKISLIIGETVMTVCFWGSIFTRSTLSVALKRLGINSRVESGLSVMVFLNALWMVPGVYLGFSVAMYLGPVLNYSLGTIDFGSYKRSFIIGVLSFAVFLVYHLRREIRELADRSTREKQELERRTLQSQIAALTSQMNPHIMFNALNSIASLIATDPKIAESMTVTLSSLYRRVLEASKNDMHSLSEELELCKTYLEIESIRFSGRLSTTVSRLKCP